MHPFRPAFSHHLARDRMRSGADGLQPAICSAVAVAVPVAAALLRVVNFNEPEASVIALSLIHI